MQTFNEFFVRELKPDARPIAYMDDDSVAVCAADCRLTAFKSVDDSLRFWIKVFSTTYYILNIIQCFSFPTLKNQNLHLIFQGKKIRWMIIK